MASYHDPQPAVQHEQGMQVTKVSQWLAASASTHTHPNRKMGWG